MMALTNSYTKEGNKCRINTVYFEDDLKIQILLWGTLDFTSQILKILEILKK